MIQRVSIVLCYPYASRLERLPCTDLKRRAFIQNCLWPELIIPFLVRFKSTLLMICADINILVEQSDALILMQGNFVRAGHKIANLSPLVQMRYCFE